MESGQLERQELEVTEEEYELLEAEVRAEEGARIEIVSEGEGIEPITIIAVIGGAAFVGGMVDYIIEKRKGGHVIDLREGATKRESRSKDVEYGLVVVYAADGKVRVLVKKPKSYFHEVIDKVIDAVKDIATGTVEAASDAVKNATGSDTEVKVEREPS
jgi:hypothetical protein